MILSERPADPIGLIGIGLLGTALARRLLAARISVLGHDLSAERTAALTALGGTGAASAAEVFGRCGRILLSLPSHHEVESLLLAASGSLRRGSLVIDTTTGDPASTGRVARQLAEQGIAYLDATVSGSSAQVAAGQGILMVGGAPEAFERGRDLFAAIGGETFYTGGIGTGARMKLVTNLVLGLNRAVLAEGLALAESLQLDLPQTLAILRACPAYSRAMDTKGDKMLRGDFSPEARLAQHHKDVRLILAAGRAGGLPMPLSHAHDQLLAAAEAAGLGALDNSAVIQVLRAAPGARPS